MNRSRTLMLLTAIVATGMGIAWAGSATQPDGASPRYEVDRSTECVLPGEQMRHQHPHLLKHQRDRTVHLGERGAKVSLKACVDCHAGAGAGISAGAVVGQDGAFCESCHTYSAVKIDCFECHRTTPSSAASTAAAIVIEAGKVKR